MKTRKVRKLPEVTIAAMYPWYKATFERYGWMVLAHHYGVTDNVTAYKKTLDRLCDTLCEKLKTVHDEDHKADLTIMQKNVEILIRHAKRDFK